MKLEEVRQSAFRKVSHVLNFSRDAHLSSRHSLRSKNKKPLCGDHFLPSVRLSVCIQLLANALFLLKVKTSYNSL